MMDVSEKRKKKWRLALAVTGAALVIFLALGIFVYKAVAEGGPHLPIYSVETDEKDVAVTVNCAWGDADIPELLALFDEYDVEATFFILGQWAEKYPDSTRAIAEAGHEIGSHSNTHPNMTGIGEGRIREELDRSAEHIKRACGIQPVLFRAPSGAYDNQLIDVAAKLGYQTIQWDVDSRDWQNPSSEEMAENVLSAVRPGSILLFHSGAKNTPAALAQILQGLTDQDYDFVNVSDLIYEKEYSIDTNGRQVSLAREDRDDRDDRDD